jgi:hypothetical protein
MTQSRSKRPSKADLSSGVSHGGPLNPWRHEDLARAKDRVREARGYLAQSQGHYDRTLKSGDRDAIAVAEKMLAASRGHLASMEKWASLVESWL